MCCEICPRYVACEEKGHLNDLCCVICPDRASCYEKGGSKDGESRDGFDEGLV